MLWMVEGKEPILAEVLVGVTSYTAHEMATLCAILHHLRGDVTAVWLNGSAALGHLSMVQCHIASEFAEVADSTSLSSAVTWPGSWPGDEKLGCCHSTSISVTGNGMTVIVCEAITVWCKG